MDYKINKDNIIKHECNVLYNILDPKKLAKYKISYYSPIIQDCMNTRIEREN